MGNLDLKSVQTAFCQAVLYPERTSPLPELIIPGGRLETANDALDVYRRAYRATMTKALGEIYEAVWSVLGDAEFCLLADAYRGSFPSTFYNLSDYGEWLPGFLTGTAWEATFPFLADLARFEWAFKAVFHAAPAPTSAHLAAVSPASRLQFVDSLQLLRSEYAVYGLWQQRKEQERQVPPEVFVPEQLALYKGADHQVWVIQLEAWQWSLWQSLVAGASIEAALDVTVENYAVREAADVQRFFAELAGYGVITGLKTEPFCRQYGSRQDDGRTA